MTMRTTAFYTFIATFAIMFDFLIPMAFSSNLNCSCTQPSGHSHYSLDLVIIAVWHQRHQLWHYYLKSIL